MADPAGLQAPDTETAELSRSVIRRLRMIVRALQGHSHAVEKACGISAAQLWALWELERAPGLKVSDLAKRLSIQASTASNLLDKLEQRGLVERQRRERDQRVVRIFLTAAGKALLTRAPAAPQGELNRALERMNPDQIRVLDHVLAELASRMTSVETGAGLQVFEGNG